METKLFNFLTLGLTMRHGTSGRRQRNRNGGGRRGGNNQQRTQVYDSNGPDVRIRGTAHQVAEKYLALAKDASSSGDWIVAENYFQHAEHYIRIINEFNGTFDAKKIIGDSSPEAASDDMGNKTTAKTEEREDLSLPASIIGKASAKSQDALVDEEA